MEKENYIVVLGASGNIGGKIAGELISRGERVAAVARDKRHLSALRGAADLLEGDFNDDAFMSSILRNATALFCTVPDTALAAPQAAAARLLRLLQESSVGHVVNISNATLKRNGNFTGLLVFEQELSKAEGLHVKHLRCANFFENLNRGIHSPYKPELKLPYISSYEIASVAAEYLQNRNFAGISVDELLGERDYSMAELAALAGLSYQQLPYTDANIGFYKPFNEGNYELVARTAQNTTLPSQEKFTLAYFLENELSLR